MTSAVLGLVCNEPPLSRPNTFSFTCFVFGLTLLRLSIKSASALVPSEILQGIGQSVLRLLLVFVLPTSFALFTTTTYCSRTGALEYSPLRRSIDWSPRSASNLFIEQESQVFLCPECPEQVHFSHSPE